MYTATHVNFLVKGTEMGYDIPGSLNIMYAYPLLLSLLHIVFSICKI